MKVISVIGSIVFACWRYWSIVSWAWSIISCGFFVWDVIRRLRRCVIVSVMKRVRSRPSFDAWSIRVRAWSVSLLTRAVV